MEKFLRCFTPPNMRKTIPDKIFFGIGRVRYLYSALLFLMFFCLFSLDAASNDYILAGNVKITDKLKSYGYIEIEIPIYDDNGADEAVKPGSYVAINGYTVFEFASEDKAGGWQNDDSWYWAKAKLHSGSAAKVRTYVTASKRGYSANTWYDVTTEEQKFPYSKVQGRTSAIYQIYPNVSDLQEESLSLAIFVKPDQNSGSDAPDFTVRHSSTNLNMKADVPTLNWSYSNTFGQFIVSFNGTSGDQYKLTGQNSYTTIRSNGNISKSDYTISTTRETSITLNYRDKLSDYQYFQGSTTVKVPALQMPNDFKATQDANGNVNLTWSIPGYNGSRVSGDKFEIQRSNNKDFGNAEVIGSVDYANTNVTKQYSFTDVIADKNLNGDTTVH